MEPDADQVTAFQLEDQHTNAEPSRSHDHDQNKYTGSGKTRRPSQVPAGTRPKSTPPKTRTWWWTYLCIPRANLLYASAQVIAHIIFITVRWLAHQVKPVDLQVPRPTRSGIHFAQCKVGIYPRGDTA